jgi:hypothetical protein
MAMTLQTDTYITADVEREKTFLFFLSLYKD